MKKINHGKRFEEDFKKSAESEMFIYRLKDPPQSFSAGCNCCPKQKTRFSPQNISDFVAYKYPSFYLLELKSTKQMSIPFTSIVKNDKDKRLSDMACAAHRHNGVFAMVLFNFRNASNGTYAVRAESVLGYIKTASRKSIPIKWIVEKGIRIESKLKRTRYGYNIYKFLSDIVPF